MHLHTNFNKKIINALSSSVIAQNFIYFLSAALCVLYSVKKRDVGRFLAKFNPLTNTFGNRLVRLHCLRIHPSVKLSTPK